LIYKLLTQKGQGSSILLSHSHNDKVCLSLIKGESMAQQLSPEELASFKELLISGMIEIKIITQLLFEK
jgi:hypothetical protein